MAATLLPAPSPATALDRETLIREIRRHADDRVALFDGSTGPAVTYAELWRRVEARRGDLGLARRSVVVVTGDNDVEWIVTYLALLDAGHVPLLASGERQADRLADAWSPGATVRCGDGGVVVERHGGHDSTLHPELALLLSTSGSTGGPKLVRLSHRNLLANARSIVESLGLRADDCGITSLPLHYSYGLSILHTHLLVGASLVVTDGSVVDPCFAAAVHRRGVTNLAGVPHSWEMLERADADRIAAPSLRLMTQAGGRLAPDAVTRWLDRADRWGAEFVVMYGQTEATARIACLRPETARRRPVAIGNAIPGGRLDMERVDGVPDDAGELVYRGPNVMMGYAVDIADLGRPPELTALRTGDLARHHAADDVYEIIGRRSRFVKPFGLRIDLDEVEAQLRTQAADVSVSGDDHGLRIAAPGADGDAVRQAAVAFTGLPAGRVEVIDRSPPRTASGKVDYAAIASMVTEPTPTAPPTNPEPVAAVFATVLGVADPASDATFVSLGGDSLSYVECSIRLEAAIGQLPGDWHVQTLAALAAHGADRRRRRWAHVDTSVLLRAIGICLVVSTHMRLRHLPGGAHLMLGLVGYNVARFVTPIAGPLDRLRAATRTVARVAVPTMIWVAVGMVAVGAYGVGTFFLINNYVGPASHAGSHWHFWFIEVFVHLVLAAVLLLALPPVRRAERRFPYGFALALLAVGLVLRLEWSHLDDWYNLRFRSHGIAWFFALGWLVHRSSTVTQRFATTVVAAVAVQGFFGNPTREWLIAVGLIVLVWLPTVPFPRAGVRLAGGLAAASMWIYLSHFTFWPLFDDTLDLRRDVAYLATIASGVAVWAVAERAIAASHDALAGSRPGSRGPWLGLPNIFESGRRTAPRTHDVVTTA